MTFIPREKLYETMTADETDLEMQKLQEQTTSDDTLWTDSNGFPVDELDMARYNEYVTMCGNANHTPMPFTDWCEFDIKYREHVRTAVNPLSPVTFERVNKVNQEQPSVASLQTECETKAKLLRLVQVEAASLRDKVEQYEEEIDSLNEKYHDLVEENEELMKEVTPLILSTPSNQPLFPHYFKETPKSSHIDIYWVLKAWDVTCPCVQHAIKKLMAAGMRGAKNKEKDLKEARDAITRALELGAV